MVSPWDTDEWYISPLMEHYKCVKCYMTETSIVTNTDTLNFFRTIIPSPKMETEDYLHQ